MLIINDHMEFIDPEPIEPPLFKCKVCKNLRPKSYFEHDEKRPYGVGNVCKECRIKAVLNGKSQLLA